VENDVNNYNSSHVWRKNLMTLGPLTTKFRCLMFTHPKSTMRAIPDNSTLGLRVYLEHIKQSTSGKRRYQLWSFPHLTKKMVNFGGPLTRKFKWLMFTHPKMSTAHGAWLMRSHSPGGMDLWRRAASRWALLQIF